MRVDTDAPLPVMEAFFGHDKRPIYTWNGSELAFYHFDDGAVRTYLLPIEKQKIFEINDFFNQFAHSEPQAISEGARSQLNALTALRLCMELSRGTWLMRLDADNHSLVLETLNRQDENPVYTWNGSELVCYRFDDGVERKYILPIEEDSHRKVDNFFNRLPLNTLEPISEDGRSQLYALADVANHSELSSHARLVRVDAGKGMSASQFFRKQDRSPLYLWNGSELVFYYFDDGAVRRCLLPVEKDNHRNVDDFFNRLPLNELQIIAEDDRSELHALTALWNHSELSARAQLMRIEAGKDLTVPQSFQELLKKPIYVWDGSELVYYKPIDGAVRKYVLPVEKDNLENLRSLFNSLPLNEPQPLSDETFNRLKLLSSRLFRFVVDIRGDVWFAPEGTPNETIPGHGHMLEGANCLSAGNVYVSADGRELLGVSNKSGDYKPSLSSLFWLFRNLFLHPGTFPFMVPSKLQIVDSRGFMPETVVTSALQLEVTGKCSELSIACAKGSQGPEVKLVIVRGSDSKRSQRPAGGVTDNAGTKKLRTVDFYDYTDFPPEMGALPGCEPEAPLKQGSSASLFAGITEAGGAISSPQDFSAIGNLVDDPSETVGLLSREPEIRPMPRSRRSLFAPRHEESPAASSSQDFSAIGNLADDPLETVELAAREPEARPMPRSRRSLFAAMKEESPAASSSQDFSL